MLKFIQTNIPHSATNLRNFNNNIVLSTIISADGDDKGSSGSDNDSEGNLSRDSECQGFNTNEQDQIMQDLLFALDP